MIGLDAYDPWIWIIAAIGLGVAELLLPGYVMLGLALGAGAVSGLLFVTGGAGFTDPVAPFIAFGAASVAAWAAIRVLFGRRARWSGRKDVNDFTPR